MPAATTLDARNGKTADDIGWGAGTCSAPEESLREVCRKLGVEGLVDPVKGLFANTLPVHRERIGPIALLHLDGDWYESTRDILNNLFDAVAPGAPLQVDDYGFWDGCKRAMTEFQQQRGLTFQLNEIDGIGVWFYKGSASGPPAPVATKKRLLNIGCGTRFHEDWANLDLASRDPGVIVHNIRKGLPFADASFDAVYHSHVLEHLPRNMAPAFLRECHRVLVPGGMLRVVVPDLETVARLYLKNLDGALEGDSAAAHRYEWMVLELLDQMVREESGGEMRRYWQQAEMPAEDFVIERMGSEARRGIESARSKPRPAADAWRESSDEELLRFRRAGEVHKWMYDRFSLGNLLTESGFVVLKVCAANESSIPDFQRYLLDCEEDGSSRKPDSLFMEARKPLS